MPKGSSKAGKPAAKAKPAKRKLKVFRTSTGFRDAYVAAPSRAAALRAWGASKDLFARGAAEEVTDPALTAEPLSRPGEVVTRSRGGIDEQVAALGPQKSVHQPAERAARAPARKRQSDPEPAPEPPPSRDDLDAVEQALVTLRADSARAEDAIRARERALAQEHQALRKDYSARIDRLEAKATKARKAYEQAVRSWRK